MKPVSIKVPTKPQTPLIPAGIHPFTICGVYCIGTIPGKGGFEPKNTVLVAFELPDADPLEFKENDGTITRKPRMLSKRYNLSFNEKAKLRIDLESLRGRPFTADEVNSFDLAKVVGACGNLNVMHKTGQDKVFTDITGLFAKNKGQVIVGSLEQQVFSIFSLENAAELKGCNLPEWIQKLVETSDEYITLLSKPVQRSKTFPDENSGNGEDGEDAPF